MTYVLHKAIREVLNNVPCTIDGDSIDDVIVKDENDDPITIDTTAVTTKLNQLIADEPMRQLRLERDRILKEEVDPIVSNNLRWNEMTTEKQTEWSNYRTALLNLPADQTPTDEALSNITFPTKPE